YLMLQQEKPEDFVLATGVTTTVREFCERAFHHAGIELRWEGEGVNEIGINKESGKTLVEVDPTYFRPTEVELLIGDASKAKEKLGWEPKHSVDDLVKNMVEEDFKEVEV
ncbi:MAG TPA: GDP-mannose 4,6-dehydratase, partial [Balneolaceae bacterium]|nr:GDP-mannose 4,6-dehydratase [Balneolaceae bacterium]